MDGQELGFGRIMKWVSAPFTQQQVDNINAYQNSGFIHPLTCAGGSGVDCPSGEQQKLIATTNGMVCPGCGGVQVDVPSNWLEPIPEEVSNYWKKFLNVL